MLLTFVGVGGWFWDGFGSVGVAEVGGGWYWGEVSSRGRVLGTQIIVEIQFSTRGLQALFGLLKWEEGGAWESLKGYRPDPGTQL